MDFKRLIQWDSFRNIINMYKLRILESRQLKTRASASTLESNFLPKNSKFLRSKLPIQCTKSTRMLTQARIQAVANVAQATVRFSPS